MSLDLRPARYDIHATAGTALGMVVLALDGDNALDPLDLSGATITANVLRGEDVVQAMTQSLAGAGNNELTLSLSSGLTDTIGTEFGLTWEVVVDGRPWLAGDFRLYVAGDPREIVPNAKTVVVGGTPEVKVTVTGGIGSGGGGSGAVDSVNTKTGVVVLHTDDLSDAGRTNKFATSGELAQIAANAADLVAAYVPMAIPLSIPAEALAEGEVTLPVPIWFACTLDSVDVECATAPSVEDMILDVLVDGTSAWDATPANRPSIATSATSGTSGAVDNTAIPAGGKVTIAMDQYGDTVGAIVVVLNVRIPVAYA